MSAQSPFPPRPDQTWEKALAFLVGLLIAPFLSAMAGFLLFLCVLSTSAAFAQSGPVGLIVLMAGTFAGGLLLAVVLVVALWRWIRRYVWLRWFVYGALAGFALGWVGFWASCGLLFGMLSVGA